MEGSQTCKWNHGSEMLALFHSEKMQIRTKVKHQRPKRYAAGGGAGGGSPSRRRGSRGGGGEGGGGTHHI